MHDRPNKDAIRQWAEGWVSEWTDTRQPENAEGGGGVLVDAVTDLVCAMVRDGANPLRKLPRPKPYWRWINGTLPNNVKAEFNEDREQILALLQGVERSARTLEELSPDGLRGRVGLLVKDAANAVNQYRGRFPILERNYGPWTPCR